jgi:hypothetical protein
MIKHIGGLLLAVAVGGLCFELGHKVGVPSMGGFVTPAEAIVNRPLTPVRVAGVAHRTTCSTDGPPPEGAEVVQTSPVTVYYC